MIIKNIKRILKYFLNLESKINELPTKDNEVETRIKSEEQDSFLDSDKRLDEWLSEQKTNKFPKLDGDNYPSIYKRVSEKMKEDEHLKVEKGAILSQLKKEGVIYDEIIYLTNHGPKHINHVIENVSKLIRTCKCKISPYEAYLLLMAIQFHDVGIIYGREKHEENCQKVMESIGTYAGFDDTEKRTITTIAKTHSGYYKGDKDTIRYLEKNDHLSGFPIRNRLLASLLRLSDELADDKNRADRFAIEEGNIPLKSKIFHEYSLALKSIAIKESEIYLNYEFTQAKAMELFDKDSGKTYLLDEIYNRILKMHLEKNYCMKHMHNEIEIWVDSINVKIKIFDTFERGVPSIELENFSFAVENFGYPSSPDKGLKELCAGIKFDGEQLKKKLEEVNA